jgi:beta-aspartyl-peptidase (threonine type)
MRKASAAALIVSSFFVAAGGSAAASEAEVTAIRKVLDDQTVAWNRGDLPGFMAGYWKSKDLTFFSGKEPQLGWDATLARYEKRYRAEGKEMGKLLFSELDIKVLSPEFAVARGSWHLEMKAEKREGLFTLIMRKMDQGWLIVHDHTSSE